jgi:RHS repeat-associated protein
MRLHVSTPALKFATYARDAATGLDYADQRYYASNWGRFTSPDLYGGSASGRQPQTWNRYAYVIGDPINSNDPSGLNPVGGDANVDARSWRNI